jgi:hypothetical protein
MGVSPPTFKDSVVTSLAVFEPDRRLSLPTGLEFLPPPFPYFAYFAISTLLATRLHPMNSSRNYSSAKTNAIKANAPFSSFHAESTMESIPA